MSEMQNETPLHNGESEQHIDHPIDVNGHTISTSPSYPSIIDIKSESIQIEDCSADDAISRPPLKKRKLTDPERKPTGQRPVSPPWKKIAVEGPTSFVEEGRRKSSRTNFIPVDLQPSADKRKTRAAISHSSPLIQSKYGGASSVKSSPLTSTVHGAKVPLSEGKHQHRVSRSPGKIALKSIDSPPAPSSQLSNDAVTIPKRSHKKKIRPISPSTDSTSVPIISPMTATAQPLKRKVGRPPLSSYLNHAAQKASKVGRPAREGALEDPMQFGLQNGAAQTPRRPRLHLRVNAPTVSVQHPENLVRREMADEIVDGMTIKKPKFSSFEDWLEKEGTLGLETGEADPRITDEEARREARLRNRISAAARPNGLLSPKRCTVYQPEEHKAPARLYTHQDRLIAHAVFFQKLMAQEKTRHLKAAKDCAERVAAFVREREERHYHEWKQDQPKSAEEIAQEQEEHMRGIYRQLTEDLVKKWNMITEIVDAHRQQQWQEEQERLANETLNQVIETAKEGLKRRRKRPSEIGSDEDSDAEVDVSGDSESEEDSEHESNMSTSESENEDDQVGGDDDEGLTQDQLREKYAQLSSAESKVDADNEAKDLASLENDLDTTPTALLLQPEHVTSSPKLDYVTRVDGTTVHLGDIDAGEIDDALLDDSDASTDMDDEDDSMETSEEDDAASEGDSSEGDEGAENSLLGFFGANSLQRSFRPDDRLRDSLMLEDGMSDDEAEEVSLIPDATQGPTPSATSEEPFTKPHKEDFYDRTEKELNTSLLPSSIISEAAVEESEAPATEDPISKVPVPKDPVPEPVPEPVPTFARDSTPPATPKEEKPLATAVPSLIRGNLRNYQHYGLDWLAGMYNDGKSGILADEMGLGKTLQTIALLAHLAVEKEVWGPHLIVVPTSVMLNWEIEFKKFLPGFKVLTYYGSAEERKRKRIGSMSVNPWNVWITSYQIAVIDVQVFNKKRWHYMVLDEAHNIKNFHSVRWKTLLNYNTHSRLLLTGTPLQNNLQELWSLLFFVTGRDISTDGNFFDLDEFNKHFKKSETQILENGRQAMNDQSRRQIANLHQILRPHLLRRLKADVEKQMPGKYEHVVYCRLSKRQRYLYDGFMSRAQTREILASANTFSIMNALMQLRKVCNHPDLFETRDIKTSYAMPRSAVADFEIKEFIVRRNLLKKDALSCVDLDTINLLPGGNERMSALDTIQRQRLGAIGSLRQLTSQQWQRVNQNVKFDGKTVDNTLEHFKNQAIRARFEAIRHDSYLTSLRSQRRPLFSHSLARMLRMTKTLPHPPQPEKKSQLLNWYSAVSPALCGMVKSLPHRSQLMEPFVQRFGCITPKVVATSLPSIALTSQGVEAVTNAQELCPQDPYHEARVRLSIAFPDKRLLQYDCGKLQKLDALLRTLQVGGHRALIFTQMTKVLDILEQFLNIHGHRYLRLDGATRVEQRQALTERFNSDARIPVFILSSRSGGIGINLTGADTVIFYDMDWNPAMDKQCQDRCHRIGQTRDVHIYRLVSEHTIEANILRKANQKRMLDDVVIQEGDFTTDQFNAVDTVDAIADEGMIHDDEANEAFERVLGGSGATRVLEQVEDVEDTHAAKQAEREAAQFQDAADFDEKAQPAPPKNPGDDLTLSRAVLKRRETDVVERTTTMEAAESGLAGMGAPAPHEPVEEVPSCDDYMLRFVERELRNVPFRPVEEKKSKKSRNREHLIRKR